MKLCQRTVNYCLPTNHGSLMCKDSKQKFLSTRNICTSNDRRTLLQLLYFPACPLNPIPFFNVCQCRSITATLFSVISMSAMILQQLRLPTYNKYQYEHHIIVYRVHTSRTFLSTIRCTWRSDVVSFMFTCTMNIGLQHVVHALLSDFPLGEDTEVSIDKSLLKVGDPTINY